MDRIRAPALAQPRYGMLRNANDPVFASPKRESGELIAARRALMMRKALMPDELDARAVTRRNQARHQHVPARVRLGAGLTLVGLLASWLGNLLAQPWLLALGYGVATCGLVLLCMLAAAMLYPKDNDLGAFYQLDELPAGSEDIARLSRLSQEDPELARLIAPWWENPAPIRNGDIALAMDFVRARKRD
ncbi:hypothetical protein CSC70_02515 [Pseudoxanthomonas kalamensis DSM 18571]|nr:hypothetical protein CSC70_02515 [Pseudoxanthomonas kalamensis DSM 18571]